MSTALNLGEEGLEYLRQCVFTEGSKISCHKVVGYLSVPYRVARLNEKCSRMLQAQTHATKRFKFRLSARLLTHRSFHIRLNGMGIPFAFAITPFFFRTQSTAGPILLEYPPPPERSPEYPRTSALVPRDCSQGLSRSFGSPLHRLWWRLCRSKCPVGV